MRNRFSVPGRVARTIAIGFAAILLTAPAMSQSFYGSLIAIVKDAQGGLVPGASVALVNTATNERREGVSGADGTSAFVNLVPGAYRLEV